MSSLSSLKTHYDLVVVGGGVHGAAVALEGVRLGFEVLLVEKNDFCSLTSANSLKIIHGGLRYLQSFDIRRSRESAQEQSRLLKLFPHLVEPLPCLMGAGGSVGRSRLAISAGLWFYDNIVRFGLPKIGVNRTLAVEEANELADLRIFDESSCALLWHDAQVKDSERLVLTYLKTAETEGADIRNYTSAVNVDRGQTISVDLLDEITKETSSVKSRLLIDTASMLNSHPSWSRAANLILNRRISRYAVGLQHRNHSLAGRLYFATPFDDVSIVGTWYFPDRKELPAELTPAELDQCIKDVQEFLPDMRIDADDVLRVHVGRLPIARGSDPLSLLEKPVIRPLKNDDRMIGVTGVKYTTARPTAKKALRVAGLSGTRKSSDDISWYGTACSPSSAENEIRVLFEARTGEQYQRIMRRLSRTYGSVGVDIAKMAGRIRYGFDVIPECDAIRAEIDYCIEREHCKTVPDFLLRRSGIAAIARPSYGTVEYCATAMGDYFGWTEEKIKEEKASLDSRFRLTCAG